MKISGMGGKILRDQKGNLHVILDASSLPRKKEEKLIRELELSIAIDEARIKLIEQRKDLDHKKAEKWLYDWYAIKNDKEKVAKWKEEIGPLEELVEITRKAEKEGERKAKERIKKLKPMFPEPPIEEIEDSFQRLLQKKSVVVDPRLIKDLPMIAPSQLDKRYIIEEAETPTDIIKKYQRRFGNKTVTYFFLIPKEEYKEGQVPTFGEHFRKALLIMSAFAVEQKTLSPVFRKEHIFRLEGKADNEIKGGMYESLDNVFKTIAYATYEIENDKKGKEYRRTIGHITDNVNWIGKGRGSCINCVMNRQYWSAVAALIEGEKGQFISIPKDRLTETLSGDEENFLNYIDSLIGLRNVYPIQVKTIFIEKLGYQIKSLKKMGSSEISRILDQCLNRAKTTGRLKEPFWNYDYKKDPSFKNILNWKIKLFLSPKEEQNTYNIQGE